MTNQASGSFDEYHEQLKRRIRLEMEAKLFDETLLARIREIYADLLRREPIVLTRKEKKRLLQDALRDIFDEILENV